MAFCVRAKDKDSAKKMLDELMKTYSSEIVDFDFYEDEFDLQRNRHIKVELRNVGYKGGSLAITIPSSVAKYMGLEEMPFLEPALNQASSFISVIFLF
jgi:hypothetical protein